MCFIGSKYAIGSSYTLILHLIPRVPPLVALAALPSIRESVQFLQYRFIALSRASLPP
jgi:hypothetical protein